MHIRFTAICAMSAVISFLVLGSASAAAEATQILRNEKVVVTKSVVAPGEIEPFKTEHPSVVVYLAGQSLEKVLADGSKETDDVERGRADEEPAETGSLRNTGSSPLIFVRVEFLTDGSDATWGTNGLAPNYTVRFEDRYSRTYDIRMAAHGSEPEHSHHDRVVVCLSGASLMHILPDGTRQPATLKTDEIGWRPAQTHRGLNLGDTDLWVIAIEPK